MFSLICTGTRGCVNNRDSGDLRRHHVRYDVIVMMNIYAVSKSTFDQMFGQCSWTGSRGPILGTIFLS